MRRLQLLPLLLCLISYLSAFTVIPYIQIDYAHYFRLAQCEAKCSEKYGTLSRKILNDGTIHEFFNVSGNEVKYCEMGCQQNRRMKKLSKPSKEALEDGMKFWQASLASTEKIGSSPILNVDLLCQTPASMDSDFDETITGRLGLELKRGSVSPTRYIVQWKQRTKESKTHDETQWITASVEHEPIINVEGMMPGLLYRFQVTAIGPSGRLGDAVTSDWIEATNSKTEIPPFEGLLIAKNGYDSDHGVNALITWPKSSENSCGYRITYSNSTHITTKDSEVDSSAGILLTNLEFDAAYTVQIRSLGAKLDDSIVSLPISSSFKTFSCSQIHGRGSINCPPEPVDEFKVEVHVNGTVNLSWRPIAGVDNILTYRIEYYAQENEPKCDSMTRTIYLKAAADSATISVDPGCRYTVKLTNFDLIGREAAIEREFSVNLSRPLLSFPLNWQILLTIFLFCLVLFVICLLKCTLSARCRQKVNEKKNKLVGEFA